jgi:chorismate mutase/prephenate dehydratase
MKYLQTNLPNAKLVDSESTASGAELACKTDGAAAVGCEILSSLYDLRIVANNIQNLHNNRTRFMVLANCKVGHNDTLPTGYDLTLIMFSFPYDKLKSLNSVLSIFIAHNVELVRIDSRPTIQHLWYYVFKQFRHYYYFVQVLGHESDNSVVECLSEMRTKCSNIRVFGSFPFLAE